MLKDAGMDRIMKKARELKIVIPAFNVAYLPMLKPIADALKENQSFGLVEVARPDVEKFGAISYRAVVEEYHKYAHPQYMRLHLDHVPVIDEDGNRVDWEALIRQGIDLGFDSVMIDGSRLPLEENIAVTKKVVEMAHAKKIPVEAELGAVLGHEKGPLPPYEELFSTGKGFTEPEEAKKFVSETGVDWLSVAIGNIHGAISGAAKDSTKIAARLNIDHLKKLRDETGIPLVLHGGSGIAREYVLEGIRNGISKINVGTEIRQAYERGLKEREGNIPYAQEKVFQKMNELICDYYGIKGSALKLDRAIVL